ncbi:MAG TPA: sulfotransferase [Thermoplasmata archaeon]|nr:sulfotransferase [Thermoplasmata archaeon]
MAQGPPTGHLGPPPRPLLLYIVGHHRSGATALGAVLGSDPSVFFAGELYRFPVPIWTSGDGRRGCSCGAAVLACPFWSEVRRAAEARDLLGALARGQRKYERWITLPRTLLALAFRRPGVRGHAAAMAEFAGIVAGASGARVLVEYGPSAARARVARELSASGFDVRYLHLVRDGRGFLASELATTSDPEAPGDWVRNPVIVVARWLGMNLAAILLCARGRSRYLRIRYEELLDDPRATLSRIGRFLGADLSEVIDRVEAGTPIPMRHIAAGNRARLSRTIVLARSPPRHDALTWATRAFFWAAAGWFAGPLGYRPGTTFRRSSAPRLALGEPARLPRVARRLAAFRRAREPEIPEGGGPR